ncbi:MAG: hypothetical protein ACLUIX_06325 [Oscillospiraceae bacterium]
MRKGTHPRTALGQTAAQMIRRYYLHDVARDSAALTYYLLFAIFPRDLRQHPAGYSGAGCGQHRHGLRQIVPGDVAEVVRAIWNTFPATPAASSCGSVWCFPSGSPCGPPAACCTRCARPSVRASPRTSCWIS